LAFFFCLACQNFVFPNDCMIIIFTHVPKSLAFPSPFRIGYNFKHFSSRNCN
jgi:hypothetical protein